jgi:Zn-finger nucleic acid-binding protein
MRCPECRIPLVVVEREGIEIDWCLECRGMWFDEGELELLGEKAGRSLEVEDLGPDEGWTKGQRRCPRCPRRMSSLNAELPDGDVVEIDRCVDHGFWLDRGELGKILSRLDKTIDTDEDLMLEFLGETFAQSVPEAATPEGR